MNKYSKYFSALLAGVALIGLPACTDTWDEHYVGSDTERIVDAPSLLAQVQEDAALANYLKVLQATGYDKVLASPQTLTIWAPEITAERADELIASYKEQKTRGVKDDDNTVILQFVKNHMALYSKSVSVSQPDTAIKMLNGKYLELTSSSLDGRKFLVSNRPANNGIFYKLGEEMTFHPNIREYLELNSEFDSLANFIKQYDTYELNERQSVQKGLDSLGLTVYADSVMDRYNDLLNRYSSFIQREDSDYTFVAPVNEVWKAQYDRYFNYFNYISTINHRDSIQILNTRRAIFSGLTFNNRTNNSSRRHETDSVTNTQYMNVNGFYGLNMFEKPWEPGGIYYGLDSARCSNGRVLKDTEGRIDPTKTFFQQRFIMGSRGNYYWIPQDSKGSGEVLMNITIRTALDSTLVYKNQTWEDEDGTWHGTAGYEPILWNDQIKNKNFLEISHSSANLNAEIYYQLPNTFSNVYYNVYAVMCPAIAAYTYADYVAPEDTLPTRFQVYFMEKLEKPRNKKNDDNNPNEDISYPASWGSALNVPDAAAEYKDGDKFFKTIPNKVCIIPIDIARKSNFSCYGVDNDYTMRYRIITNVRSNVLNKTWTNKLRINRLIYIPFDTEEEATNFDLSDLNDYQN